MSGLSAFGPTVSHSQRIRQASGTRRKKRFGTGSQIRARNHPGRSPLRFVDQFQEGVESHLQMVFKPLILLLEHQLAIAEM